MSKFMVYVSGLLAGGGDAVPKYYHHVLGLLIPQAKKFRLHVLGCKKFNNSEIFTSWNRILLFLN